MTMLGAALAAFAQDDIKRVLAWSTVSQLAYMLGALAVGSYAAATFHLLTHGAFKALLFLAAGAVIHAAATNSLREMGGLGRLLPVTYVTMTIGLLALAGVPPLSGFFSKEAVLASAEEVALHGGPVADWAAWLVLVVGLLTVGVTAAYAIRLWLLTFRGNPATTSKRHDVPALMRWPLVALAIPAALLGVTGLSTGWLPTWLSRSVLTDLVTGAPLAADPASLTPTLVTSVASTALVLLGATAGYLAWRGSPVRDPADRLGRLRPVIADGWYLDRLYATLVVRPVARLAAGVAAADTTVVAGAVRGSGETTHRLAATVRRLQDGDVQRYLTVLLAGVVLIAVAAVTAVAR
jgi:NADH-quinone oxidoreductase subunit L